MTKPIIKTEKSITTKTLEFDAKKAVEAAVAALGKDPTPEALAAVRVPLGVVFGMVTGVKLSLDPNTGETRSALLGQFEGSNVVNGVTVRAPRAYIPQVQEMIENDFNALPANVRGNRMNFQANIFATYFDDRYGFRYAVDLPLRDATNDPLAELRKSLTPIVPASSDAKGDETPAKK